jgi:hypothetical protein
MALYTNRDLLKKQAEAKAKAEKEAQEKKQAEVTNEAAEEEVLNEGLLYRNEKDNISIGIYSGVTDTNMSSDLYVKAFNSSNPKKATKVSRVHIMNGKVRFDNHKNSDGKENWELEGGGNYKKKFAAAMKAAPNIKGAIGDTVWKAAFNAAEKIFTTKYDVDSKDMPDFKYIEPCDKKNKRR